MSRAFAFITALIALSCTSCAPFVERVDMRSVSASERLASSSVQIVYAGAQYTKPSRIIGDVEAYSCKHLVTDPPANKGNALQQLRLKAYRMGANAVLDTVFDTRGTDTWGTNCWETVHVQGIAVVLP
jgi:uncharacterized protein YbjQ (UPF0145 family)